MNVICFNYSEMIIRIPLFVIFFWFGILKPFGLSSATQLVMDTVYWMPIFSAYVWMQIIGWYEVFIGIFWRFGSFEESLPVRVLVIPNEV